jgi:hypothetical protein
MLEGCRTTYAGNNKQDENEAMSFHARPSLGNVCRQSGHFLSYGQYLEYFASMDLFMFSVLVLDRDSTQV